MYISLSKSAENRVRESERRTGQKERHTGLFAMLRKTLNKEKAFLKYMLIYSYSSNWLYHSHFICIKACEKDLCSKDWVGIFCYCCYRLQPEHKILNSHENIHFYQISRYALITGRLANTNTRQNTNRKQTCKHEEKNRNRANGYVYGTRLIWIGTSEHLEMIWQKKTYSPGKRSKHLAEIQWIETDRKRERESVCVRKFVFESSF